MKKVTIYARVLIDKQTCENQLGELRAVATRMGCIVYQEYVDNGISGAKFRVNRQTRQVTTKSRRNTQ